MTLGTGAAWLFIAGINGVVLGLLSYLWVMRRALAQIGASGPSPAQVRMAEALKAKDLDGQLHAQLVDSYAFGRARAKRAFQAAQIASALAAVLVVALAVPGLWQTFHGAGGSRSLGVIGAALSSAISAGFLVESRLAQVQLHRQMMVLSRDRAEVRRIDKALEHLTRIPNKTERSATVAAIALMLVEAAVTPESAPTAARPPEPREGRRRRQRRRRSTTREPGDRSAPDEG